MTINEIIKKYSQIEDKIPSTWKDYKTAGIELAQDICMEWDITDPELYRVISLVSIYSGVSGLTEHLDMRFSYMGLYPNIMKSFRY